MRTVVLALFLAACGDDGGKTIDAPIDAPIDASHIDAQPDTPVTPAECAQCTANQTCVTYFGGVCQPMGVACVDRPAGCDGISCSAACEAAFCTSPYQCEDSPCPNTPPNTFGCYGP